MIRKSQLDSSVSDGWSSAGRDAQWPAEEEFFGEHGAHTGDLLLLVEAGIITLGLEVPGHHVIHPGQYLHDLQLFAMLIQHGAEGLHKPGAFSWVPP